MCRAMQCVNKLQRKIDLGGKHASPRKARLMNWCAFIHTHTRTCAGLVAPMLHACHVKVLGLLVWGVPFPSPPPQFFPASLRGGPWRWFLQIWAGSANLPLEPWGCPGEMAPCCPEGVRSPEPWSWPLSPAPLVPVGWPNLGRRDRRGESHSRGQVSRGWVVWASPT